MHATRPHSGPQADAVKDAVSILDVVQSYGIAMRRQGREYAGLSPFKAERTPSFYVDTEKQVFKCFASGEGGDVIRFVELMDGCDFRMALAKLAGEAGLSLGDEEEMRRRAARLADQRRAQAQQQAEEKRRRMATAWDIWQATRPAEGTPVEAYLAYRGIDCAALERVYGWRVPHTLRYAPDISVPVADGQWHRGPAMVGAVSADVRERRVFRGIHRTMLAPGGLGKAGIPKAKKTLVRILCAETRLSPEGELAVIGEGYETVLSVMSALARDGRRVFGLSALFLDNLAGGGLRAPGTGYGRAPTPVPDPERPGLMLPPCVRRVILLKDADGKEPGAIDVLLRRAATKFRRAGIATSIAAPEAGKDFNDVLMSKE